MAGCSSIKAACTFLPVSRWSLRLSLVKCRLHWSLSGVACAGGVLVRNGILQVDSGVTIGVGGLQIEQDGMTIVSGGLEVVDSGADFITDSNTGSPLTVFANSIVFQNAMLSVVSSMCRLLCERTVSVLQPSRLGLP